MGTRLLTKAEVKDSSAKAREAEFRRATAVHEFITKEEKELNAWKLRKAKEMEATEAEMVQKKNDYAFLTSELMREVSSLESRKREALKPITHLRKELEQKELRLAETASELDSQREKDREEREIVFSWKADLADQAENLKAWVETLSNRERGLKKQEEYVSITHQAFNKHIFERKQFIQAEESRIAGLQDDLQAREALILKDKEWILKEKDTIAKDKRAVASERAAVQSAYDQLKKKL